MRVVIVGAGKVGFSIAQMLALENHDVVVIEQNEERRQIVAEHLDVEAIAGHGASVSLLREVGVKDADMLVAVTELDELNMIACLMAKRLGVRRTVARVRNPQYVSSRESDAALDLGIDLVINPELVTAQMITKLVEVPEALNVEFYAQGKVQLLELALDADAPITGQALKDITFPHSFLVAAVLRQDTMLVPRGEDRLVPGDIAFIVAETRRMPSVEKLLGKKRNRVENVFILGGGRIGYYLARDLAGKNLQVTLMEKDRKRCQELCGLLNQTLVLQGDGTDLKLLEEEDAGRADLFVAVTGDDKVNLLVSLLAKHLGAKRTIAQVRRSDYASLVEKVGVDVAVSPRTLTAGAILKYIRRGDIVSVSLLGGAKAEMVEFVVPPHSRVAGKTLQHLKFPKDAIIGAIVRANEVIVPSGADIIQPEDHVIVFALPQVISKVENFFTER